MIELRHISKQYGSYRQEIGRALAVDDISFSFASGEFITLLGPSGCGKTTTLRAIAGLEDPTGGSILIAGEAIFDRDRGINVPTYKRPIGMVFQSYAIWPHMSVLQNVTYPLLTSRRMKKAAAKRKATAMLDMVGLGEYMNRAAPDLSGGQQQRVALARALVSDPSVLLLDEPLSNLDAGLREEMAIQLLSVQKELAITTVFVTHDQQEALAVSDTIVVMNAGRIVEHGRPADIYDSPKQSFTGEFMGVRNRVSVTALEKRGQEVVFGSDIGEIVADCDEPVSVGDLMYAYVHPHKLALSPADSDPNGVVAVSVFRGDHTDYEVQTGESRLQVRIPGGVAAAVGQKVRVAVKQGSKVIVRTT